MLGRLALKVLVRFAVAVVAFFALAHATSSAPRVDESTKPLAHGSPAWLIAHHGCWTGRAPRAEEGKLPGHVVVTLANGDPAYSSRLVGAALDHVLDGKPATFDVWAFCR